MAITFVGASNATGNNQTINKPVGVQSGDLLVANIYVDANNTISSPPSGWTVIENLNVTAGPYHHYILWKSAGASEPSSYTFTNASTYTSCTMVAFRPGSGNTLAIDVHASQANASGTTDTVPSVTTTGANEVLIAGLICYNGFSYTTLAGWTAPTGGNTTDGLAIQYKVQSSAGATGTFAFAMGGSSVNSGALIAIQEQTAGGGGTGWNQAVSDSHSGLDLLAKSAQKPLLDAHSALEGHTFTTVKAVIEALSALDAVQNQPTHTLGDRLSATDAWQVMRGALVSRLDAHSGRDTIPTKNATKALFEATSGQESTQKAVTHRLSDAVSLLDALAKMPAKTLADFFSERDSATVSKQASGTAWHQNVGDAHSALDLLVRNVTKLNSDAWSSVESFTRTWVAHLFLQEVFSATEMLAKQVTHPTQDATSARDAVQTLSGTLVFVLDALSQRDTQQKVVQHLTQDSFSAQDLPIKQVRHVLADSLSATDKATAGRLLLLRVLDALSLTDAVAPSLATASGRKTLAMVTSLIGSSLGIHVQLLSTPFGMEVTDSNLLACSATIL